MIWLVALHGVVAVLASAAARTSTRRGFAVAALAPGATLVWAALEAPGVLDGEAIVQRLRWVEQLGLGVDLRLDAFSLLFVGLISGVGLLVCAYSAWYFPSRRDLARLVGQLTAFAGSMLGIVLADNLLLVYVFWELTSVTSYLLIGFDDRRAASRSAALQAILVTGSGGLAMLGGFVLLGQTAGTYSLSGLLADPPRGSLVGVALALVLLGAFTKSAQAPFHFWLPGAMAAPTPVSAYLHSATMVKAGVYLIARFAPAFADGWEPWRPVVVGVGVVTMLLGAWQALRQHDLKLLLAHGTVSQLGFMVALLGSGHPELTFAGVAVVLAHGLFKAALFLVVGIVDHQTHTRDLRALSGIAGRLPALAVVAGIAVASMAGVFPLIGFLAKEAAYEALLEPEALGDRLALIGIAAGSALTTAYGARLLWGAFASKAPSTEVEAVRAEDVGRPALPFVTPAAILAVLTVVLGVAPAAASEIVGPAATALDADVEASPLSLWHGFTTALGLSLVTLTAGLGLFALRRPVERLQQTRLLPRAASVYQAVVTGLLALADRTTAVVQNGSLPMYLAVILGTVLALPGSVLLTQTTLPDDLQFTDSPLQVGVAVLAAVAAVAAAGAHRRFVAIVCLGGIGFSIAVLFVLHGAPDLALTQLLIETLAIVIFVLVLRHLPERFRVAPWRVARGARLVLAIGVGTFVTGFALVAAAARRADPVSQAYLERALPEGEGRNVVNVILVDFRGLDTLGEITVLAVAALGILGLVFAGRGERER
jgi:multicomponent Na+:H+ antiporter subunit A